MGRRALRKIDPALDLTPFLKISDDLPRPFSTAALFKREAPLEIEVGSGKGLFMQSAAQGCAEHNFLGIEIAGKYARFAAARLARRNLRNALMVHGDAQPIFADLLPAGSIAAVHVYFPDPWWKKRHRRRRVMNEFFARNVQRVLISGGALHFWTDVEEYFETTLELLARETSLAGPLPVAARAAEHDLDYRTHFERRMRLHDQPVYRSEFKKP